MRELANAMIKLSWSVPLFGVSQMAQLVQPQGADQGAKALSQVADAVSAGMGSSLKQEAVRLEKFQHQVVDMMLGGGSAGTWNPSSILEMGQKMFGLPTSLCSRLRPGHSAPSSSPSAPNGPSHGWGPVVPPSA